MKSTLAALVALSILSQSLVLSKTWTDKDGRQFDGKLESLDTNNVSIRRETDNKRFTIDRAILSDQDQQYLEEYETKNEVLEFIEQYPSTLDDSIKLSIRKNLPSVIFYQASSSQVDYFSFIKNYMMNEEFEKITKRRAILAFVTEKENRLHTWVNPQETMYPNEPWFYAHYHGNDTGAWYSSSQPAGVQQPTLSRARFLENFERHLANAETMKQ